MHPGQLRHQVTIQESTAVNVGGVPVGDWADVCTIWASVEDLSGRELFGQGAIAADISTRIVARWRPGINQAMRALFGSRLFEIQTVIDPEGRRREMHLMCKERFDAMATNSPAGWRRRSFSGAIDGMNRRFVLDAAMQAGAEFVLWNGLKQAQDGLAYSFDGRNLVMAIAPNEGDTLEVYGSSGAVPSAPGGWKKRSFSGAMDGANQRFVLAAAIIVGAEFVLWNGLKQPQDGTAYAFDGRNLVMAIAPNEGDSLEIYG